MDTNLQIHRNIFTERSTTGDLFLGSEFLMNTLEDTCRRDKNGDNVLQKDEKVWGSTAIPAGTYEIKMEPSKHFQRKMPFLQNVPYFSGVMIHWGNKPEHTNGCILVGSKYAEDFISESQKHYNELEPVILKALENGRLYITITGGYTA